jgi:hypothetical protein
MGMRSAWFAFLFVACAGSSGASRAPAEVEPAVTATASVSVAALASSASVAQPLASTSAAPKASSGVPSGPVWSNVKPPSTGDEGSGVAECDAYVELLVACTPSPEVLIGSLAVMRDSWRSVAETPQGKEALKASCKAALNALAGCAGIKPLP